MEGGWLVEGGLVGGRRVVWWKKGWLVEGFVWWKEGWLVEEGLFRVDLEIIKM